MKLHKNDKKPENSNRIRHLNFQIFKVDIFLPEIEKAERKFFANVGYFKQADISLTFCKKQIVKSKILNGMPLLFDFDRQLWYSVGNEERENNCIVFISFCCLLYKYGRFAG